MRELSFRGMSYTGEMIFGTSIINRKDWVCDVWVHRVFLLDGDACNLTPDISKFVEVRPDTVGQFTGLTDKAGTDIYEGDIIKGHATNRLYPVFWKENSSQFYATSGQFYIDAFRWEVSELVGNIHQNSDLLS